jgi:hypothetical protein
LFAIIRGGSAGGPDLVAANLAPPHRSEDVCFAQEFGRIEGLAGAQQHINQAWSAE